MLMLAILTFAWAFCVSSVSACMYADVLKTFNDSEHICPLNAEESFPIVLVALLVRNKEHILPHFLAYFEKQNYPKKRMILWIRSDHNLDRSGEILQLWINHTSELYRSVDVLIDDRVKRYRGEYGSHDWTVERRHYHMRLKENALNHARQIGVDYVFFLDADVLLTHEETITHLVSLRLPIVAPLLKCPRHYIHFKVVRPKVLKDTKTFLEVSAVSQAVLIKLDYPGAQNLTFDLKRYFLLGERCLKDPPQFVDHSIFAASAQCAKLPMLLNHRYCWGYFMQPQKVEDLWAEELLELVDMRLEIVMEAGEIAPVQKYLEDYVFTAKQIYKIVFKALKTDEYKNYVNAFGPKMLFDEIYMVNLDRRLERRAKMEKVFKVLDMEVTRVPAVEPKSTDVLRNYNITIMPGLKHPFDACPIKLGEIGCFLSHFNIWKRMVAQKQQIVLILEDDGYLAPCFKLRVLQFMESARSFANYDLLFLGRLRSYDEFEPWFRPKNGVQYIDYSLVTVGYILTLRGAEKLLAARPLEKLMPVDEFLCIMYGAGRNQTRMSHFPVRNLIALAPEIVIIRTLTQLQKETYGYISDTRHSMAVT